MSACNCLWSWNCRYSASSTVKQNRSSFFLLTFARFSENRWSIWSPKGFFYFRMASHRLPIIITFSAPIRNNCVQLLLRYLNSKTIWQKSEDFIKGVIQNDEPVKLINSWSAVAISMTIHILPPWSLQPLPLRYSPLLWYVYRYYIGVCEFSKRLWLLLILMTNKPPLAHITIMNLSYSMIFSNQVIYRKCI